VRAAGSRNPVVDYRQLCIVFVAFFIFFGAEQAESQEAIQWSVTPYIWASDTSVDLTFRDTDLGNDRVSFNDLMDVLDSAFMINVEGGKGPWSVFGDLTYLETSDTNERVLITVDTNSRQTVFDTGVAYWPGGAGSALSVIGGLRYTGFDDRYTFRVDDALISERRNSNDYYDVLLGVRYRFDLSERWSLLTHADFSFGDSRGTFMLRANFAYTVGKRQMNRIVFGYQYKQADFEDGDLTTDFSYQGPMAGFNFRW
jgi:hypothetical protein